MTVTADLWTVLTPELWFSSTHHFSTAEQHTGDIIVDYLKVAVEDWGMLAKLFEIVPGFLCWLFIYINVRILYSNVLLPVFLDLSGRSKWLNLIKGTVILGHLYYAKHDFR